MRRCTLGCRDLRCTHQYFASKEATTLLGPERAKQTPADCTKPGTADQSAARTAVTRSQARWAAAGTPAEPGPRTSYQKSAEDLPTSFFFLLASLFVLLSSRQSSHFFLRSSVLRDIVVFAHDDFLAKRPRSDTEAGFREPLSWTGRARRTRSVV